MVKSVILLNTVEDKIVNLKIQNVNVEAAAAEREHQVTSLDSKTSEGSAKILKHFSARASKENRPKKKFIKRKQ